MNPGRAQDVAAAAQNFGQHLSRQVVNGEADNIQCGERRAAHRIHVGEGVSCGDSPKIVRVVHDGCKEIHRLNQRKVRRQANNPGIVARVQSDQQIGMAGERQRRKHLLQSRRPDFARSTSAGDAGGQPLRRAPALIGRFWWFRSGNCSLCLHRQRTVS